MQRKYTKADIKGREVKGITYVTSKYRKNKDLIVAKEIIHMHDGARIKHLRMQENYERSFYVTKPSERHYTQKQSSEALENLIEYRSPQCELQSRIARALDYKTGGPNTHVKKLARSPYLYGADVSPVACFKNEYLKRYPGITVTPNEVAVLDIETDVIHNKDTIIMLSITMGRRVKTYVLESFIENEELVAAKIENLSNKYIKELMLKRQFSPDLIILDSPGQIVAEAIKELHVWQPDIVAIWNAIFDMTRLEKALLDEHYDPAEIFSDPRVPKEYRQFKIIKGNDKDITASGVKKTKNIEEIWNWFLFPASFQVLDAMCVYNAIRFGAKESSYALNAILAKEKVGSKLVIPGTDKYKGLRWHEVMQSEYKLEYIIYNIVDCVEMEELDEKITDLRMVINEIASHSDFRNLNSGPKRLIDRLHFWYLNQPEPRVIGSTPDEFDETYDKWVIDHRNIIVTLPAYMLAPTNYDRIKNAPDFKTYLFKECADLDITSTYPTASILLNIDPRTVVFEFSRIKGITAARRLALGINLTSARGNAILIAQEYCGAPSPNKLLDAFIEELENEEA